MVCGCGARLCVCGVGVCVRCRDSPGAGPAGAQMRTSSYSTVDAPSWRTSSPRSTLKSLWSGSSGPGWLRTSLPQQHSQRHSAAEGQEPGSRLGVLMEATANEAPHHHPRQQPHAGVHQKPVQRRKSSGGAESPRALGGRLVAAVEKSVVLRSVQGRTSIDDLALSTRRTSPGPGPGPVGAHEAEGSSPSRSRLHISAGRSSIQNWR